MKSIKIGVVGIGRMGALHCGAINKIHQATLRGVYDVQETRRQQAATSFDCLSYASYDAMLQDVDAVILALPSSSHYEYFVKAVHAGRDVFVEKPFVTSLQEASQTRELMRGTDRVVQVGHIERFSSVVSTLSRVVSREELIAIETRRCNLSGARRDVDVVLDLMIHDIDIVLSLVSSPVSRVTAISNHMNPHDLADWVAAAVTFQNGVVANLSASRVSYRPERCIVTTEQNRTILADCLNKTVSIFHLPHGNHTPDVVRISSTQDELAVPHGDALYDELSHFVDCVQTRKHPLVNAWNALVSIELALEIQNQVYGDKA